MDDSLLWERLTGVFRAVFGRDSIAIQPDTTTADIDEWGSLNHLELVLAVQAEFGVRLKQVEVASFDNVGDMMDAIKRQLANTAT